VRDQQTHKGDSDCDGRNKNPSSTLPVLHHAELLSALSIAATRRIESRLVRA
jgi:hypothetical protein